MPGRDLHLLGHDVSDRRTNGGDQLLAVHRPDGGTKLILANCDTVSCAELVLSHRGTVGGAHRVTITGTVAVTKLVLAHRGTVRCAQVKVRIIRSHTGAKTKAN